MADENSLEKLQQYLRKDYFPPKKWELLNTTPLGKRLAIKQLDSLSMSLDAYELPAGVVIFEEDEVASYFAILVQGRINILKKSQGGAPKIISTVSGGTTLGELALIDNAPRSATAVAAEQSTLLVMTKERFQLLLEKDPALSAGILLYMCELMAARLRRASDVFAEDLKG